MKIDWSELVEATLNFIDVDPKNKAVHIGLTCAWKEKRRLKITAAGVEDAEPRTTL